MIDPTPQEDPLEQLKRLKAQQTAPADDPLEQLKAMRGPKPAGHDYHAEYASGALAKRMQGANARDLANAAEPTEVVGPVAAAGHALGATMANMGEGIPGFEAGQAGLRSLVRREPYAEALGDLRRETGQLPSKLKGAERIAGALPLAKFLPASPIIGGAILGAADQALSADPNQSLAMRAMRTAVGAGGGALLGKTGELAATGVRAALTKSPAANVIARKMQQALSAKRLYGAAIDAGQGKEPTPAVQEFLQEPDIAGIVERLQQTRPFQGVEAHDPRMLDEIYKTLSDHVKSLGKGLAAVDPRNANSARVAMSDARQAQARLLAAVEQPGTKTVTTTAPPITTAQSPHPDLRSAIGNFWDRLGIVHARKEGTVAQQMARQALERHGAENVVSPSLSGAPPGERVIEETVEIPAMMPGYRAAVDDFAEHGQGVRGVEKGYDALRTRLAKALPKASNLTRTTPEALNEWAAAASDAARDAAGEGILGAAKDATGLGLRTGLKAMSKAPSVMRDAQVPAQQIFDRLMQLGLLSANAARPR